MGMNKSKKRAIAKEAAKFRRRLESPALLFRPGRSTIISYEAERRRSEGQYIPNREERRRSAFGGNIDDAPPRGAGRQGRIK